MHENLFAERIQKFKDYQLSIIAADDRVDPEFRIWSDLIQGFQYLENDIPKCAVSGAVKLKIANFSSIYSFHATPMGDPWLTYRLRLCKLLEVYCTDRKSRDDDDEPGDLIPKKGLVYFVKVSAWHYIDKYMEFDKGGEKIWKALKHLYTNKEEDSWQAGKWFRATMIGHCGNNVMSSECFEFRLIDVGRIVPIYKQHIRKAVFRFLNIPKLAIEGCLLLHNEQQIHEKIHEKWYNFFTPGTEIQVTVFPSERSNLTAVRMSLEDEQRFDAQHQQKFAEYYKELSLQHENQNPWTVGEASITYIPLSLFEDDLLK